MHGLLLYHYFFFFSRWVYLPSPRKSFLRNPLPSFAKKPRRRRRRRRRENEIEMSTVALSKRPFELLDDPSGGAAMTSNTNFHQQHGDGVENINGAYFGYSPSKRCRGGAWSPQPSTPPSQLHQQQQQQQHPHPQHATAPSTPTATLDASSPVHRSPTRLFPTTQHDSVFRSTGETFALSAEDVDRLLPNRKRVRAFQQQPLSPSSPTLASSSSSSSSSSSAKVPTVAAAGPSVARADLVPLVFLI